MPARIRNAAGLALVLVATACSGGAPAPAAPAPTVAAVPVPTAPAAPSADPGADRAAIEQTLADYDRALLARDFAAACALLTPQAADGVVRQLSARGATTGSCPEAFAVVYAQQGAAELLDSAARTTRVDDVAVAGDTARVTYSGEAGGRRQEGLTTTLQRIDGAWRVQGTG